MFWKSYQIESSVHYTADEMQSWLNQNRYKRLEGQQSGQWRLQSQERYSFFSFEIMEAKSENGFHFQVHVQPKFWVLIVMLTLVYLAVQVFFQGQTKGFAVGLSRLAIPGSFAFPYIYFMALNSKRLELMHLLRPNYLNTTEGRVEQYSSFLSLANLFANVFNYVYIVVASLFTLGVVLWMFDVIDPKELLDKVLRLFDHSSHE